VRRVWAVLLLLALATAGCGPDRPASTPTGSSASLTVFAAASLRTTFTQLGARFEAAHPGTSVSFSFAGSADLVTQLQGGAPADVYASADATTMDKAVQDHLVLGDPVVFTSNRLEIVVPRGNPAGLSSLAALAAPGLQVVVCAPQVPCGAAARRVEAAAGVSLTPVSEESSGEADAGLVYVTDVRAAGDTVTGVVFPEARRAVNQYPIAVLGGSRHPDLARDFVSLVTAAEGQRVLKAAGFGG
jgi:molybdate transport system substrate-binding protein